MPEIEILIGNLDGKVDGINDRLDKLNGNISRLWDANNGNRDRITAIASTCAERHKSDVAGRELKLAEDKEEKERKSGEIVLTTKNIKVLLLFILVIAMVAIGGTYTAVQIAGVGS
jgi:hypothetical protein